MDPWIPSAGMASEAKKPEQNVKKEAKSKISSNGKSHYHSSTHHDSNLTTGFKKVGILPSSPGGPHWRL